MILSICTNTKTYLFIFGSLKNKSDRNPSLSAGIVNVSNNADIITGRNALLSGRIIQTGHCKETRGENHAHCFGTDENIQKYAG